MSLIYNVIIWKWCGTMSTSSIQKKKVKQTKPFSKFVKGLSICRYSLPTKNNFHINSITHFSYTNFFHFRHHSFLVFVVFFYKFMCKIWGIYVDTKTAQNYFGFLFWMARDICLLLRVERRYKFYVMVNWTISRQMISLFYRFGI